jgi:transposase
MLRVTFELGKEAGNVCLRRSRRAPQALPGGGGRPVGEVLTNRNVPDGVEPILKVIGGLPPGTPAAFEAAYGTCWLVELLENYGFTPHLVHSLRCKAIASARLKNDKVDAATLAQLLWADLLPEAWIAPPPVRQLRALLRYRVALVRLRTLLRNRIHAIVADYGHDLPGRQKLTAWAPADMLPDGDSGVPIEAD